VKSPSRQGAGKPILRPYQKPLSNSLPGLFQFQNIDRSGKASHKQLFMRHFTGWGANPPFHHGRESRKNGSWPSETVGAVHIPGDLNFRAYALVIGISREWSPIDDTSAAS
jgi:hypothetical protein